MHRSSPSHWGLALVGLLVVGCDTQLRTEHGQVRLSADLHSYDALGSGHGIVEQSTVCVDYTGHASSADEPFDYVEADDEELRACYEDGLEGPAGFDQDGCLALDTPGTVTWDLTRVPCSRAGDFGDDQVIFEVLPLSATRGAFRYAVPMSTEVLGNRLEGAEDQPGLATVGEPIYVIEDGLESIGTAVVRDDRPELVAVTEPLVSAVVISGAPTFETPGEPSSSLRVQAQAGDAFDVTLTVPAGELEVGHVEVVSRAAVESLSLHPVVVRLEETDFFLSLGAKAVARDADGNLLQGAPVQWTVVEGEQALSDSDGDGVVAPGPEAWLEGACEGAAAGELRSVTLEGRMDDFVDTVRVEWDCIGSEAESGCQCNGGARGLGGLGWLVFPLLVGWRRRWSRGRPARA